MAQVRTKIVFAVAASALLSVGLFYPHEKEPSEAEKRGKAFINKCLETYPSSFKATTPDELEKLGEFADNAREAIQGIEP